MKIRPMPRARTRSSRMPSTCSRTVTSSAEVGSSAMITLGLGHQHHGDHDALAHAARDLVRVEPVDPLGVADLHRLEHLERLLPRLAPRARGDAPIGLGDLVADALHRVQREFRVLQDHRDPRAADVEHPPLAGGEKVGPHRSPCGRAVIVAVRQELQERAADRRLARPGLADDAELLAPEVERHVAHRLHRRGPAAVGDAEVLDVDQDVCHQCRPFRCLGSSTSRRPSPNRLKARLTRGSPRRGRRPATSCRACSAGRSRPSRPIPAAAAGRRGRGSRGRPRSGSPPPC